MKELTPEIIKILEQFTDPKEREEILKDFEDGWYDAGTDTRAGETNPERFCGECKTLGFCKILHPELYKKHLKKQKQAYRMDEEKVKKIIPLKEKTGTLELFGEDKKEQLQKAHEAFHIEDYETAILNYKAFLKKHSYEDRVRLYVAMCSYFLGNFNAAIYHTRKVKASYTYIKNFKLHCSNVMNYGLKSSEVEKMAFQNDFLKKNIEKVHLI